MKLFEPLNVKGMVLPNRIMVPAMVTRLSGEDGFVNEPITDRYVRYAQGGVGLIVVEAMAVHHAKSGPLLRISDDAFVPGLADLVRRIHDTSDSKVVPQIIHFLKVAKSGWRQTVDTLSLADIDQIVEEFGDAAAKMEPGQVSDPIKTQFGWHVIKLDEKRPKVFPPLDEVKDQVARYIVQKAQSELVMKLRDGAKIERADAPAEGSPGAKPAPAQKPAEAPKKK